VYCTLEVSYILFYAYGTASFNLLSRIAPYFINLVCLTPDDFICQGESAVFKDAVQSDLRMCTKEPSFYLQTVYLGFYFILCSCKA
jgi:hypothetical protein